MKSEAKTIINIINTERIGLMAKLNEAKEKEDETAINKFLNQIQILDYIQNKLCQIYEFTTDEGFMEVLQQNYGKHNTELIAVNGNKYIINKDEPVGIHENLLFWPESSEDPTIVPPIDKAINLDNIIEINTIKED